MLVKIKVKTVDVFGEDKSKTTVDAGHDNS